MAQDKAKPAPLADGDRLIGSAEAAKILGVSQKTIRMLVNQGRLPSVRVMAHIRVRLSDIERFIKQNTIGGR